MRDTQFSDGVAILRGASAVKGNSTWANVKQAAVDASMLLTLPDSVCIFIVWLQDLPVKARADETSLGVDE